MSHLDENTGSRSGFLHPKTVETIIAVMIALVAFLGTAIWNDIGNLAKNSSEFREKVLSEYVQKKDYQIDVNRLYDQLNQINKKLDRIAENNGNR